MTRCYSLALDMASVLLVGIPPVNQKNIQTSIDTNLKNGKRQKIHGRNLVRQVDKYDQSIVDQEIDTKCSKIDFTLYQSHII